MVEARLGQTGLAEGRPDGVGEVKPALMNRSTGQEVEEWSIRLEPSKYRNGACFATFRERNAHKAGGDSRWHARGRREYEEKLASKIPVID
ncbi:unnamed protein product [Protopolystoma xenopodis]|uniref:Uncharacterized protein n=1 Tax=Protopolystoma xenopodis TaxID=117903 RepID=A0A3S5C2A8_9PLAT|nr:unnamed protein product [Protopolystoma xenopodis]